MEAEELDRLVATVHAYAALTGVPCATAFLDAGEGEPPVVVECPAGGPVSVGSGESGVTLASPPAGGLPLPPLRPVEPVAEADARAGRGLDDAAAGVRALADLLPGRSVVTIELPIEPGEQSAILAARRGEPPLLALGADQIQLG